MADKQHPILNYLRQLLGTAANGGVADADLLRRFVDERDEAAFELLLWRHAAMVLQVCRQVLRDADAVEDAFQAAFLVFVRKAGSISRRESLGGWLYRVAYRIALQAKAQLKKRASTDVELDCLAAPKAADDADQHELRRIIGEEVNRLPAKYRAAVVACYFEAKTLEEAAHQLGWPRGTVASRLARARELLRRRLVRRGVTLPTAAFTAALSVQTSSAALTGLIHSTIKTAKLFAVGQSMNALLSPRIIALAEGVLKAMYWTRMKIVMVVLLIAGLGGAGATFWGTQRSAAEPLLEAPPLADKPAAPAGREARGADAEKPEDVAKLARNMALSRLNLKKLAVAMHNYNDTYGQLPRAAIVDKKGKALLSWRVELLPYIEEQALYLQFKRDEPWDSPHNKKLLSKMPKVFAPPGFKTRQPFSTFYQVFVSAGSPVKAGMPGVPGGVMPGRRQPRQPASKMPPGGAREILNPLSDLPPGVVKSIVDPNSKPTAPTAAFVRGEPTCIPFNFTDGTANTILIVEAGNPVPWTKPEDLHYAEDEALPELGGLFPDVFHAAFVDGSVHILTRRYDERQLRYAIMANDSNPLDLKKIEARPHRSAPPNSDQPTLEDWKRRNEELRKEVERARGRIRLLKEEKEVEREIAGDDPRINQLKDEHIRLQAELKKLRAEIEALTAEIRRMQRTERKKNP